MSGRKEDSALGVARARFVDGLPKKGSELKGALALLAATPDSERPREEMRRRMHALYASAQVFRIDALAEALKECIDLLDAARDKKRGLVQDEIDRIAHVATTLPAMASSAQGPGSDSPGSIAPRTTRKPSTVPGLGLPMPSELPPPRTAPPDALTSPGGMPATTPGGVAAAQTTSAATPTTTAPIAPTTASTEPTTAPTADITKPVPATAAPMPAKPSAIPLPRPTQPVAMRAEGAVSGSRLPPRSNLAPDRPPSSAAQEKATAVGHRTPTSTNVPVWTKPSTVRPSGKESLPGLDTVISVLLIGDAAKRMGEKLPKERFELVLADDTEAVEKARTSAPDVIVVGEDVLTRPGTKLVASLRGDPATDLVPLIAITMRYGTDAQKARTFGADDVISQVADTRSIVQVIARVSGLLADSRSSRVGTTTVRDLVDRLTDEVRRGLLDSVERGAEEIVQLDDGSEVLAAIWAAIARVRTEVGARSEGRVRFKETARRGGPSLLGFGGPANEVGGDSTLEGRRVIVADDDPAVVWFFAGLLREAGAIVEEVLDGEAALLAARKHRPDVILSDILMPRLDGLALCRELQRDPSLAEVPVILLSWKEDFLQRMRELRSGASAYLRKEEGAPQILARVSAVLAPRARFEARLRQSGELRGRVEGLGVLGVLRAVGEARGNASVSVRDAHNLFEIEIRDGDVVHITRTASDGSFARGPRALPQLLGVTAGRFTVTDATTPVRATIKGASGKALAEAAERLGAQIDAVSGQAISNVEVVRFDEDVLASVIAVSTPDVVALAKKLEQGASPRGLLVSGECSPSLLESVLNDFARRGAITGVLGPNGEDRVLDALARRRGEKREDSDAPVAVAATSWLADSIAKESPDAIATEDDVFDDDVVLEAVTVVRTAQSAPPVSAADVIEDDESPTSGHTSPNEEPTKRIDMVATLRAAGLALPPVLGTSSEDGRDSGERTPPAGARARKVQASFGDGLFEDDVIVGVPSTEPASLPLAPDSLTAKLDEPFGEQSSPAIAVERLAPMAPPAEKKLEQAPAKTTSTPPPAKKGVPLFIWAVLLVTLAGLGFVARLVFMHLSHKTTVAPPRPPVVAPHVTAPRPTPRVVTPPMPPPPPVTPVPVNDPLLFGTSEDTLRDVGVTVPAGQGLLVIEAPVAGPTDVTIDGRPRGRAPTALALPPGRHEVTLTRGDDVRIRFVVISPGHSRILPGD